MTDMEQLYREQAARAREKANTDELKPLLQENPAVVIARAVKVEQALRDLPWSQQQRVISLVVHKAGHTVIMDGLPLPNPGEV